MASAILEAVAAVKLPGAVDVAASKPIEYPESDGLPMAESDWQADWLIYAREALKDRYRDDPNVYVAGTLLIYYEEGNPAACIAPDVFVVFEVARHRRRTYKIWQEGKAPDVVIEISSKSTWLEDLATKKGLYAILGVREYFIFDPEQHFLRPPLQGFRLVADDFRSIPSSNGVTLHSQVLGLDLRVEEAGDGSLALRFVDSASGEKLLSPQEALADRRIEQQARLLAEQRAGYEAGARQASEAEIAQLRAELERLRQG